MSIKENSKKETFYSQMKGAHEFTYKNLTYIEEYVVVLEKALGLLSPISTPEKPAPPLVDAPPVIVELLSAAKNHRMKLDDLSSRLSRIVSELTQG